MPVVALLQSIAKLDSWLGLSTAMARSQATVLELFDAALAEAERALPDQPVRLSEFWRAAKSVLRLTPLREGRHCRTCPHFMRLCPARLTFEASASPTLA